MELVDIYQDLNVWRSESGRFYIEKYGRKSEYQQFITKGIISYAPQYFVLTNGNNWRKKWGIRLINEDFLFKMDTKQKIDLINHILNSEPLK